MRERLRTQLRCEISKSAHDAQEVGLCLCLKEELGCDRYHD